MPENLQNFVPKMKFSTSSENPLSETEFSYLFKNRASNGFSKAFVRITPQIIPSASPYFYTMFNREVGRVIPVYHPSWCISPPIGYRAQKWLKRIINADDDQVL